VRRAIGRAGTEATQYHHAIVLEFEDHPEGTDAVAKGAEPRIAQLHCQVQGVVREQLQPIEDALSLGQVETLEVAQGPPGEDDLAAPDLATLVGMNRAGRRRYLCKASYTSHPTRGGPRQVGGGPDDL
jgi:hypothetical protein